MVESALLGGLSVLKGLALTGVVYLAGHHSTNQKGLQFDSHSGHMSGLQILSPVRVCAGATD